MATINAEHLQQLHLGMNEVRENLTIQVLSGRVACDTDGNAYCFTHGALLVFNEATQSLRCSKTTAPCNAEATRHTD